MNASGAADGKRRQLVVLLPLAEAQRLFGLAGKVNSVQLVLVARRD